jgi:hypothetical protein
MDEKPIGDRKRGEAGRSGSPIMGPGDRKRGEAGRSGSPIMGPGDRKRGEAGRSGSPIMGPRGGREAGFTVVDDREAGLTPAGSTPDP